MSAKVVQLAWRKQALLSPGSSRPPSSDPPGPSPLHSCRQSPHVLRGLSSRWDEVLSCSPDLDRWGTWLTWVF